MSYVKVNGNWREISATYVRVGGAWREVSAMYTKVAGAWRESDLIGTVFNISTFTSQTDISTPYQATNFLFSEESFNRLFVLESSDIYQHSVSSSDFISVGSLVGSKLNSTLFTTDGQTTYPLEQIYINGSEHIIATNSQGKVTVFLPNDSNEDLTGDLQYAANFVTGGQGSLTIRSDTKMYLLKDNGTAIYALSSDGFIRHFSFNAFDGSYNYDNVLSSIDYDYTSLAFDKYFSFDILKNGKKLLLLGHKVGNGLWIKQLDLWSPWELNNYNNNNLELQVLSEADYQATYNYTIHSNKAEDIFYINYPDSSGTTYLRKIKQPS